MHAGLSESWPAIFFKRKLEVEPISHFPNINLYKLLHHGHQHSEYKRRAEDVVEARRYYSTAVLPYMEMAVMSHLPERTARGEGRIEMAK